MTLLEMLVVLVLTGIVSGAVYRFFQHYTSSYVKIDDKIESIAEGWQLMRMLKDDLMTCDLPGEDTALWSRVLQPTTDGGYEIVRRTGDQVGTVTYQFDAKKGDVTREQRFPGQAPRTNPLLKNRCAVFQVLVITEPASVAAGDAPTRFCFKVHLELGNVARPRDTSAPLVIDTNVFPVFLNQRLSHRYLHEGMPPGS